MWSEIECLYFYFYLRDQDRVTGLGTLEQILPKSEGATNRDTWGMSVLEKSPRASVTTFRRSQNINLLSSNFQQNRWVNILLMFFCLSGNTKYWQYLEGTQGWGRKPIHSFTIQKLSAEHKNHKERWYLKLKNKQISAPNRR